MLEAIRGLIAWTPLGLPAFLFVITLVVFFHELGHFLVARWFGVKVDVFSVGFGKEIFGFNDKHGTRWKLSWLPIGGYVKFAGDADAASKPDTEAAARMTAQERAGALMFKPVGQRAAVAAAGPFANFALAIVLLTGLYMYSGHAVITPVIGQVTAGSPAAEAGIRPGDLVTRIDRTPITDFQQLPEIISISGGETLAVGLKRAGQDLTVQVTPRLLKTKDVLGNVGSQMVIGVRPDLKAPVTRLHYGPLQAVGAAFGETWSIIKTTILGIGQMITGHVSASNLSGVVGIAQVSGSVAQAGAEGAPGPWTALFGSLVALLSLSAVMSVSIGFMNLLPVPVLDGGHLLFYAYEALARRPVGAKVQAAGYRVGLALLLCLMVFATWNDLQRLRVFQILGGLFS